MHPCDKPVATNTIYSDTLVIDCGITSSQLFVGTKTHTADVYPIKSGKQFVNTLLDNIEWENGEITSEPLNIFGKDDPVTCAVYAHEHGLLEEEGWKRFKGIAKREKKMLRMVNQSHIKATHNAPRYKFGYCISRNYNEVMQFDLKNGNTLWREATDYEMLQLVEYDTFRDLGHKDTAPPLTGYKKICTHLVYDCKHDGRHKAWMVAHGHLTDIPLESVYSGVISLHGLQIITFLSELKGLDLFYHGMELFHCRS
jgi:hypothetical protein